MRLVREGREGAFEEIVRRYRQPLVAFAAAYGPADPEDIVQESLTRSWQSLRQSTGEMNLKPWLYTIVRNRALNAKRDAHVHEQLTDQIDGVRQPADIALTNDELARVVTAVGALPEQQREALVRSALEGHTHEQIAEAIGATPGAVRQLIFRGRTAVRHGVGVLIPLPLVRLLAESSAAAEAGAGGAAVASGGAALTGGAASAGAGAGASLAAKAVIVAAVGAVAAGSGVAIHRAHESDRASGPPARETVSETSAGRSNSSPGLTPVSETPGSSLGSDEAELGDDHGGRGSGDTGNDHSGSGDDHGGGRGPSGDSLTGTSSGPSGSSESGPSSSSGSSGDDSGSSRDSGNSGDDSGSSGSGSSGHGSSGSETGDGGGSGSSGSGSSGGGSSDSDSSGSGSSGSGSSGSGESGSDDPSGSTDSGGSDDSGSSGSGSDGSSGSSGSSGSDSGDTLD